MSAEIVSYPESERAAQIASTGRAVIEHQGFYFNEVKSGFFWPITLLKPLSRPLKSLPGARGHKHAVAEPRDANATAHVMVLEDVPQYSLESLSKNRRKGIRRGMKNVEVRRLHDADELISAGGYEVSRSFHERTQWGSVGDQPSYNAFVKSIFRDEGMVWYGGFVDGELGGYISVSVTDGHGSMGTIATHDRALPARINDVLVHEISQRCQEAGCVQNISFGLLSQKTSLNEFKETMLYKLRTIPCFVSVRWPWNWAIRFLKPEFHRRIYGLDAVPPASQA